jgi:hypothetical protein
MFDLDELTLLAFRDELRKEATDFSGLIQRAKPTLQNVGSLMGAGGVLGAGLGAGAGALHSYRQSREQGEGVGHSALAALPGALKGGVAGGLTGAAVGAAGGALAKRIGVDPSGLIQRSDMLGKGARFGQRQVHALTGMLNPTELEGVRGGAYGARQGLRSARLESAVDDLKTEMGHAPSASPEMHSRKLDKALKGMAASEAAEDRGLTSLPGYVGAVKREGLGKVLSTSVRDQFHSTHPAMTAAMVGVPALGAVKTLTHKETPEGMGKGEELGKNLGGVLGGVVGSAMPVVGGVVAGGALEHAGRAVGRGVDRLRGRPKLVPANPHSLGPSPLEPTESQSAVERVTSPSAAGRPPEGLMV